MSYSMILIDVGLNILKTFIFCSQFEHKLYKRGSLKKTLENFPNMECNTGCISFIYIIISYIDLKN